MDSIRTQWDHTTKPSRFLVYKGDRVISDGTYKDGIQIFRDALKEQQVNQLARRGCTGNIRRVSQEI
jgi:hypothetical protein